MHAVALVVQATHHLAIGAVARHTISTILVVHLLATGAEFSR